MVDLMLAAATFFQVGFRNTSTQAVPIRNPIQVQVVVMEPAPTDQHVNHVAVRKTQPQSPHAGAPQQIRKSAA